MKLIYNLIRKLFLIKEIISKSGAVHFRRYRLLQTPWFAIYIHQICKSDEDYDMHDHPWNFSSVILSGAYREKTSYAPNFDTVHVREYYAGDVIEHKAEDVHKLTKMSDEIWTLVFTSGRTREWGYRTDSSSLTTWLGHEEYRQLKNEGKLRW